MKIALGQIRIKSDNPKENSQRMLKMIQDAKDASVDLIIFPALSVPGVFVSERNLTQAYIDEVLNFNHKIINEADGIDILFGSYHEDNGLYNVAYYAKNKKIKDIAYKSNLENYESLYFKSKDQNFKLMIDDIEMSVSLDNLDENTIFLTSNIYKHDKPIKRYTNSILVSGVGIYNDGREVFGLLGDSYFDFHTYVANANNAFEEELLIQDTGYLIEYFNEPTSEILPFILPMIEMFDEEHLSFKPKWLVGVSGGLDSAVSFALLTLALGEDRVHGVTMPGEFTRDLTLSNAHHLATKLNVTLEEIAIGDMVDSTISSLTNYNKVEGLSHENIQARLRGHTLMSVASLVNGVVCNNGNKIETALGYATIYGDTIGALSVLADLTKIEVGQLALEINEAYEEEVIPVNIIPNVLADKIEWDFAPSAELSDNQFDPFKWGYHDALIVYLLGNSPESVLAMYLDNSIYETDFGRYMKHFGMDNPNDFIKDFEWLLKTVNGASFKRLQTPPILRVSKQGFGFENQGDIYFTDEYKKLKKQILNNSSK